MPCAAVHVQGKNAVALFDALVVVPLCEVVGPRPLVVVVIDGVDELEDEGRGALLSIICRDFQKLPSWLGLLVTSRREAAIERRLRSVHCIVVGTDNDDANNDLRAYVEAKVRHVVVRRVVVCLPLQTCR